MKILAIETSCDETAVCLVETDRGKTFTVLGNALLSQADAHREFGGVYPNLAKREHAKNLVPLLEKVLRDAKALSPAEENQLSKKQVGELKELLEREPELFSRLMLLLAHTKKPDVDVIAVTTGPGLEPALWVGINFAKALSHIWHVPIIPVNHMEGHIFSSILTKRVSGMKYQVSRKVEMYELPTIVFPALALLISGGHTELVLARDWHQYEVLGETRDDAVGEAFDKVARMLGLPYPGGPEISRLAEEARTTGHSNILKNIRMTSKNAVLGTQEIRLPRPMIDSGDFDFSFSGLKTAVLYTVKKLETLDEKTKQIIAREFEDAAADVLISKTLRALENYNANTLIIGGGVSANKHLCRLFRNRIAKKYPAVALYIPDPALATDNAIMITVAGYFNAVGTQTLARPEELVARGTLPITA